jgi:hypothetical protein
LRGSFSQLERDCQSKVTFVITRQKAVITNPGLTPAMQRDLRKCPENSRKNGGDVNFCAPQAGGPRRDQSGISAQ